MLTFARTLLVALAIPAVGFLVGNGITAPWNEEALAVTGLPMRAFCEMAGDQSDVQQACRSFGFGDWLRTASLAIGILGLGLIAVPSGVAAIAGSDRDRNATVFPLLMPVMILAVAVLVLGSGAIIVAVAYRYVPITYVIAVIAFGAVGASLGLLRVLLRLLTATRHDRHTEVAIEIGDQDEPRLWAKIRSVAGTLAAPTPKNLIVGLEPNFYATVVPVTLPGGSTPLQGETLYLSLPLIRLLNEQELTAIIGHELAHFRGADARYSLRFAPVYRGFTMALHSVAERTQGLRAIALLPANAVLGFALERFALNERRIRRDRELEADRDASRVASPNAIATALAKIAVFARYWKKVRVDNVERLRRGRLVPHLAEIFHDTARWDVHAIDRERLLDEVTEHQVAHPIDTHPTVGERLSALGLSIREMNAHDLVRNDPPALALFDDYAACDARLSLLEHHLMIALGHAPAPSGDAPQGNGLLSRVYVLTAALISADGAIDPDEIAVAERIGATKFPGFDPIEFRWVCQRSRELPPFAIVTEELTDALDDESKRRIIDYLAAVAKADGRIDTRELELLSAITATWLQPTDAPTT